MDKFRRFLPLAIFCVYFTKVCFQSSTSYPEALILLILGSVAGYFEYKHQSGRMESMEKQLNEMNRDLQEKLKDLDAIKSSMASLKLQNGMRQLNVK